MGASVECLAVMRPIQPVHAGIYSGPMEHLSNFSLLSESTGSEPICNGRRAICNTLAMHLGTLRGWPEVHFDGTTIDLASRKTESLFRGEEFIIACGMGHAGTTRKAEPRHHEHAKYESRYGEMSPPLCAANVFRCHSEAHTA